MGRTSTFRAVVVGYFHIVCLDSDHTAGDYRGELVLDEPARWKVGARFRLNGHALQAEWTG
jgi:hypothetical protein